MATQTTFRFDDDFHAEVKMELAKRRMRFQAAMEQALRLWMTGPDVPVTAAAPPVNDWTAEEARLAAGLVDLVRNGERGVAELVKTAVENHQRAQRARKKASG